MRKFRFWLQGLENIRGMELDQLRLALAEAQAQLRQAEEALLAARQALDDAYNELMQLRTSQAGAAILLGLESYAQVMREQVMACAQNVARRKQELREARERLAVKHREKKVLEKFRERQFAKYSLESERETQKGLDETAQNVYQQGTR
jgi:flagellar FliJ protein